MVHVRLKYEQDLIVNLEHEKSKMTTLCDQEAKQISRLKEVLDIVKQYVSLEVIKVELCLSIVFQFHTF